MKIMNELKTLLIRKLIYLVGKMGKFLL
jgi:hypothetical protein